MIFDRDLLMSQITEKASQACAAKALQLLMDKTARLADGAPTQEIVQELLPTLRARLENSKRNGVIIYGLQETIQGLALCDSLDVLVGFGLISSEMAGNFYMVDGSFLGMSVVDLLG